MSDPTSSTNERRLALRSERAAAAPYWGGFETRIVVEFLVSTLDGVGLGLAQRSQVMVIMGFDSDDLTKNMRTLLVEQRTVPFVTDPTRVLIGNLVKVA
jgi:hypothetical protein